MSQDLYLLKHYSNYYNRIAKYEDTLEGYLDYLIDDGSFAILSNVHFNPADGVNTSQVFNVPALSNTIYDVDPDYLVVCDNATGDIVSRWFVIDSERLLNGQVKLTLRRDLIVDYYDGIIHSPVFIEKATLQSDDPLIFNSENMSYNQIKKREDLLFDETRSPWIIGYLANNTETAKTVTADSRAIDTVDYDEIAPFLTGINSSASGRFGLKFKLAVNGPTETPDDRMVRYNEYNVDYNYVISSDAPRYLVASSVGHYKSTASIGTFTAFLSSYVRSHSDSFFNAILANAGIELNDLRKYEGRYVALNNRYYKISVSTTTSALSVDMYTNNAAGYTFNALIAGIPNVQKYTKASFYSSYFSSVYKSELEILNQRITLTLTDFGQVSTTIPNNVRKLQDNPFIMFAMRYNDANLSLAVELAKSYGSSCYDVQILPYFPMQDRINPDGTIDMTNLVDGFDYAKIIKAQTVIDYIYFCPISKFTFDIEYEINVSDVKVESECDFYRLVSPNGNGVFEFNAAKNNGVSRINVDAAYKPIQPYIHLNIDFKRMYGDDFNDYRGLILNGDFSIPAISDAWVNYEINNKNYENMFNRQIEHLDVQNKYQMFADIAGAITGTASTATLGAGLAGLPGGIAGGVVSAAAGAADVLIQAQLRDEAKDLTVDLYNYNLQNIQALPNSITKTGCLTNNNKLVPYVEYYSCTDREKDALRDKLKWNGMTVMTIGYISDYLTYDYSFIKGQLIRYEGLDGVDFHTVNNIAAELNKGVFIK